jgi:DNA-binding transcriptional regulator YhcF (GntR family)
MVLIKKVVEFVIEMDDEDVSKGAIIKLIERFINNFEEPASVPTYLGYVLPTENLPFCMTKESIDWDKLVDYIMEMNQSGISEEMILKMIKRFYASFKKYNYPIATCSGSSKGYFNFF